MKILSLAIGLILSTASLAAATATPATPAATAPAGCPALLNHRFTTLQGKPLDLCQFRGKAVMVVNTASYCGYTEQYKGLQALYDRYRAKGLVVVGFPANDFGKQEPGTNAEVADFCERTYKVKFPMTEKTSVVAGQANPLHEALFAATGDRPKWNFHKFLIAADGRTVTSYPSKVSPDAPELVTAVERALSAQ